jgi:hypothetical protein
MKRARANGRAQLTAESRPLTSNDLNTLVQGARAAQARAPNQQPCARPACP